MLIQEGKKYVKGKREYCKSVTTRCCLSLNLIGVDACVKIYKYANIPLQL